MKWIFLGTIFLCTTLQVNSRALNSCDEDGHPEYFYDQCPEKVIDILISKVKFTEKQYINGEEFFVNYHMNNFSQVTKRGAITLSEAKKIELDYIDIDITDHDCQLNSRECDLDYYKEHIQSLVGDISVFFQSLKNNSNSKSTLDNILGKIVSGSYKANLNDVLKGISYFFDTTSKKVFFRYLDNHGNAIAYIWADIDLNRNVVLQEYLYKHVVSDTNVSWIGKRDYDKNASNALWHFLWERGLRRTKKCLDTIITITDENGNSTATSVTRCWYE